MPRPIRLTLALLCLSLAACSESAPPAAPAVTPIDATPSRIVIAGSGSWTQLPSMPAPRKLPGGAVVAGKLYVVGGNNDVNEVTKSVFAYDPTANSWTRMAPLPIALRTPAVAEFRGKLYVFAGFTGVAPLNTEYVYDPTLNTWTAGPALASVTPSPVAVTCKGRIYLLGASDADETSVRVLDPDTWTWSDVASAPLGLLRASAACIGDKIYVTDGSGGFQKTQVYTISTNSWSAGADSPYGSFAVATQVQGVMYVISAYGASGALNSAYEPKRDAWTAVANGPSTLWAALPAIGSMGGSIYTAGGTDFTAPGQASAAAWRFTPAFAGNHAPTLSFGGPYTGVEGSVVQFDASASSDADGDALTYAWDFGDGGTSTDAAPQHTFASFGKYPVQLAVTDSHGEHSYVARYVRVSDVTPVLTVAHYDTVFTSVSWEWPGSFTDPGTNVFSATADFDDGSGAQTVPLTDHDFTLGWMFTSAGSRAVKVAVNDGSATGYATVHVRVLDPISAVNFILSKLAELNTADSNKDTLRAQLRAVRAALNHGQYADASAAVDVFLAQVDGWVGPGIIDAGEWYRFYYVLGVPLKTSIDNH